MTVTLPIIRNPGQWISTPTPQPVMTPDIPPLWADPDPPLINTLPIPTDPHPPGAQWQDAQPTRRFVPNDRNPVTGAPVVNPTLPPDNPLPPGQGGT